MIFQHSHDALHFSHVRSMKLLTWQLQINKLCFAKYSQICRYPRWFMMGQFILEIYKIRIVSQTHLFSKLIFHSFLSFLFNDFSHLSASLPPLIDLSTKKKLLARASEGATSSSSPLPPASTATLSAFRPPARMIPPPVVLPQQYAPLPGFTPLLPAQAMMANFPPNALYQLGTPPFENGNNRIRFKDAAMVVLSRLSFNQRRLDNAHQWVMVFSLAWNLNTWELKYSNPKP